MPIRFRAASGKAAIYTVPTLTSTDDAPLTNPDAHADRIRFHSDRNYVRVVSTHTGTLTLPARAAGQQIRTDHVLFAHGQASEPMVMGRITNLPDYNGVARNVPIASMVPVLIDTGGGKYALRPKLHRWVCLAVDATNVYLREYGFVANINYDWVRLGPTVSQSVSGWTSQSINWVVHLTDFLVTGPAPSVDPAKPALRIDDSKVEIGFGKFTSEKRVPRASATGVDYATPHEKHMLYEPVHALNTDTFNSSFEVSLADFWWLNENDYSLPSVPTGPTFTPSITRCDV